MAVTHYGYFCRVTQVDTSGSEELVYFLVQGAGSTEYRVRWNNSADMMSQTDFENGGGRLPEGYDYLTDTVDDVGVLLVTLAWLGNPADPDTSNAITKWPAEEAAPDTFANRYTVIALGPMVQVVTQAELDARPPAGKGRSSASSRPMTSDACPVTRPRATPTRSATPLVPRASCA